MDDPFDLEVPYIARGNYVKAKSMGRVKKNPILEKVVVAKYLDPVGFHEWRFSVRL